MKTHEEEPKEDIEITKIKNIVEEILKTNPKSRDDDFLLTMLTYVKMGYAKRIPLGIKILFKNIEFAPAFESITRCRRIIQHNEGRFQASEETQIKRSTNEVKIHNYFSKYSPKSRLDTMPNSYMSPDF